ncbi:unnamed protein product [Rangifer tarandus platyrhynchus]|uniref:Uncharacterized protein n=2 Tax=Rangifer tarandus platyrhynchus TaxID=3082113 RepID=A0ABN9A721_RANTA|nr:unnamed protein product [Rangifer tarandus platyrhynchus]
MFAGSGGEASVRSQFFRDQRTQWEEGLFVGGVGEASMCGPISSGSRRHTQGRSPLSMGSVGKVSEVLSQQTTEDKQGRGPMFVDSVGKVSVRIPSQQKTGEKPYVCGWFG